MLKRVGASPSQQPEEDKEGVGGLPHGNTRILFANLKKLSGIAKIENASSMGIEIRGKICTEKKRRRFKIERKRRKQGAVNSRPGVSLGQENHPSSICEDGREREFRGGKREKSLGEGRRRGCRGLLSFERWGG